MKLFVFVIALAQAMMGSPPQPMTPEQFGRVLPGQSVQISVRVDRVGRSTLYATLLQRQTDTVAKATRQHVVLYFGGGTPVIMGSADDVVAGAALFVYGVVTSANHVDAERVVVDTKFVTVE